MWSTREEGAPAKCGLRRVDCREDLPSPRQGALPTCSHDPWHRRPARRPAALRQRARGGLLRTRLEAGRVTAVWEGTITASLWYEGRRPHWERAAAAHCHAVSGWAGAFHAP